MNAFRYSMQALAIATLIVLLLPPGSRARQFRSEIPIATPAQAGVEMPEGAEPVDKITPLTREQVAPLVKQVMSSWNTDRLDKMLGKNFYDRSRLTDAVDRVVPRDAILRVQSVQGVQTLQQYIVPGEEGDKLVSIVSATIRTQLEFNDPTNGFQRRPGVNEFILRVTQALP